MGCVTSQKKKQRTQNKEVQIQTKPVVYPITAAFARNQQYHLYKSRQTPQQLHETEQNQLKSKLFVDNQNPQVTNKQNQLETKVVSKQSPQLASQQKQVGGKIVENSGDHEIIKHMYNSFGYGKQLSIINETDSKWDSKNSKQVNSGRIQGQSPKSNKYTHKIQNLLIQKVIEDESTDLNYTIQDDQLTFYGQNTIKDFSQVQVSYFM